jgi:hypothetical protein
MPAAIAGLMHSHLPDAYFLEIRKKGSLSLAAGQKAEYPVQHAPRQIDGA